MKAMKDENGMIVVEAVISFTTFIMVCIGIMYFINIFTVHNRVQFAINTTAKQIAGYTYICDALGFRDALKQIQSDGEKYVGNIDDTTNQVVDSLNKMQKFYAGTQNIVNNMSELELNPDTIAGMKSEISKLDAGATVSSIKNSAKSIKNLLSDPNALFVGIIYMAADGASYAARSAIATAAAEGLTKNYLKNGSLSADEYLRSYNVKNGYDGLDFSGSTMLCDSGKKGMRVIDIVVEYDIDLGFISFVLPNSTLHMVQRTSVAAWVGGDDNQVGINKN